MNTMQLHPAYDPQTQTWFVEGYSFEAPTLRELLNRIRQRTKLSVIIRDYFFGGKAHPPVTYTSFTEREKQYREKVEAKQRELRIQEKAAYKDPALTLSKQPLYPEIGYKSGKDLTPKEREYYIETVLDMWAAGGTIRGISIKLKLKYDYVGTTIIPVARSKGDKRAEIRNHKTYGVRKGPDWEG